VAQAHAEIFLYHGVLKSSHFSHRVVFNFQGRTRISLRGRTVFCFQAELEIQFGPLEFLVHLVKFSQGCFSSWVGPELFSGPDCFIFWVKFRLRILSKVFHFPFSSFLETR
jgi:hypothetical protein